MPYLFHNSTVDVPAIVESTDSLPPEVGGLPAFYYWRSSIADGTYQHPLRKWSLEVDADRRAAWESNFRRLRAAGIEVPILADHKSAAASTLGYVIDIRQQGTWLQELHQYLGTDARDTALRNRVSVAVSPDFIDSAGNHFGEAIIHSAIVPHPLVPHQPQAIAASSADPNPSLATSALIHSIDLIPLNSPMDAVSPATSPQPAASVDHPFLSVSSMDADSPAASSQPVTPMDHPSAADSPMDADLLGASSRPVSTIDHPSAADSLMDADSFATLPQPGASMDDPTAPDSPISLSIVDPAVQAFDQPMIPSTDPIPVHASTDLPVDLPADPTARIPLRNIDPVSPQFRPMNPQLELDRLLLTGHITPASRDRFCTILAAVNLANADFHLSLHGQSHSLAQAIILALQANAPFNFATQTPIQVLPRFRPDATDLDDTDAIDFGRARAARLNT